MGGLEAIAAAGPSRVSSGEAAKATVADAAVDVMSVPAGTQTTHLVIHNEGGIAGFWSDDGVVWNRLPAVGIILDGIDLNGRKL